MVLQKFRWILLSVLVGILAGTSAATILILLKWATYSRDAHPYLIGLLPLAGLFTGWIFSTHGREIAAGHNLILDEVHNPKKIIPFAMAPFVLITTVATHLFGGSAGREGTAVQMGASLADQINKFLKITGAERKILLVAGASAGFGASIGAPWAGMVFGMEVIRVGRLQPFAVLECLVASFVGYYTCLFLGAQHSLYPRFIIPDYGVKTLFFVAIAGILFGLTVRVFVGLTHAFENLQTRFIKTPLLKPFWGGILLVGFFAIPGNYRFTGLGISQIQHALEVPVSWLDPVLKTFATVITVGSGFRGGEFIPLVFIGTTLGSSLSVVFPISFQLLAATGFAAVFAGAANTPVACIIMAMEFFGLKISLYAVVACYLSYYFSGQSGIYKSQPKVKGRNKKNASLA